MDGDGDRWVKEEVGGCRRCEIAFLARSIASQLQKRERPERVAYRRQTWLAAAAAAAVVVAVAASKHASNSAIVGGES